MRSQLLRTDAWELDGPAWWWHCENVMPAWWRNGERWESDVGLLRLSGRPRCIIWLYIGAQWSPSVFSFSDVAKLKHLDHHDRVMMAFHPPEVRRQLGSLLHVSVSTPYHRRWHCFIASSKQRWTIDCRLMILLPVSVGTTVLILPR